MSRASKNQHDFDKKGKGGEERRAGIGHEGTEEELPPLHPLPAVRPLEHAQSLVSSSVNAVNNNNFKWFMRI